MSFTNYLVIFSIYAHLSTSSYMYGLIRNATIKIPFDITDETGHKLLTRSCNECLCDAFGNEKVVLFTCTENYPANFTCQFYYFMPKKDEINYPRNNTNIYLIKNQTFEEKDDCCNAKYLFDQLNKSTPIDQRKVFTGSLRFLVSGDNNTIASIINKSQLIKFSKSNFSMVYQSNPMNFMGLSTVGFRNEHYYLGSGTTMKVYSEINNLILATRTFDKALTSVRFLSDKEMLVGAAEAGVYICEDQPEFLNKCIQISPLSNIGKQLHAIGVFNETAFYAGWDAVDANVRLYVKDQSNNTWKESLNDLITHSATVSDIFIDNCKRIWVVNARSSEISIYDKNKTLLHSFQTNSNLFNLLILDNYTLITSHESADGYTGLDVTRTRLNCRPPR